MKTLDTSIPKGDRSAQTIEKLRLNVFRNMLHALGFTTTVTWQDTRYRLEIKKGWWKFVKTIQTLKRETDPSKPMLGFERYPISNRCNRYLNYALSRIYQTALEDALMEMGVSLYIDVQARDAILYFSHNVARTLEVFPVQISRSSDINDPDIFRVVGNRELTDEDKKFARFICPRADIVLADPEEFGYIKKYLHFYLERYFPDNRSPYDEDFIMGCECLEKVQQTHQI